MNESGHLTNQKKSSQPDKAISQQSPSNFNSTDMFHNSGSNSSIDPHSLTPDKIIQLQRTIGNQAVQRLLAHDQQKPSKPFDKLRIMQREPSNDVGEAGESSEISDYDIIQQANKIEDIVNSSAWLPLVGSQEREIFKIIRTSTREKYSKRLFEILKLKAVLSPLFRRLPDSSAALVQGYIEDAHKDTLQSLKQNKKLTFRALPPDLKAYWLSQMDDDVQNLSSAVKKVRFGMVTGDSASDILKIFKKWEKLDTENEFNGKLLHEFVTIKVAGKISLVNIGWGAETSMNLLDQIRRGVKLFKGIATQINLIVDHADYHHKLEELPSFGHELKESATELFLNLPMLLAGIAVGAAEAVADNIKGLGDTAKMVLDILSDPTKIVDYAKQIISMINQLPEMIKGKLEGWTQQNPAKRAFFQGTVIGSILAELVINAVTAGAVKALKASKYAKVIANLPADKLRRIGSKIAGPLKKTSKLARQQSKAMVQSLKKLLGKGKGKINDFFASRGRNAVTVGKFSVKQVKAIKKKLPLLKNKIAGFVESKWDNLKEKLGIKKADKTPHGKTTGVDNVDDVADIPAEHTQLSQPGGLKPTEGKRLTKPNGQLAPESHPLKNHGPDKPIRITDGADSLEQRLNNSPNMKMATKFSDRAKMETAIGKVIEKHKRNIDAWLAKNQQAGKNISYSNNVGMGNLGNGMWRNPKTGLIEVYPHNLSNVRIVLKSDGVGGYVIQTAFPEPAWGTMQWGK